MATKAPAKKSAAKGSKIPELPLKARRLEEIASSKKGLFAINPLLLQEEDGFNGRTDDELGYGDLRALADDIEANGLINPLKIEKIEGTERILIRFGHRRHRAITRILIPEGRWPKDPKDPKGKTPYPVDCVAVERGIKQVDRLFMQLSENTGKPFTLLEKLGLYQRIMTEDPTVTAAEIARRTGQTKQAVGDALKLGGATPPLRIAIEREELAATTANLIIGMASTPETQLAILDKARAAAAAAGRDHILPKDVPVPPDPVDSLKWNYKTNADKGVKMFPVAGSIDDYRTHVLRLGGLPSGNCDFGWEVDSKGVITWFACARLKADAEAATGKHGMHEDMGEALRCGLKAVAKEFGWNKTQVEKLAVKALDAIPAPDEYAAYNWQIQLGDQQAYGRGGKHHLYANNTAVLFGLTNTLNPEGPAPTVGIGWEVTEKGFVAGFSMTGDFGDKWIPCLAQPQDVDGKSNVFPNLAALLQFYMNLAAGLHSWSSEFRDAMTTRLITALPATAHINPHAPAPATASTKSSAENLELKSSDSTAQPSQAFHLYQIPDAPADPDQSGNYHESERLVLENDRPASIGRLHLLSALTPHGPAYGFRIDDAKGPVAVHLPREDHPTTNSEAISGLFVMLSDALSRVDLPPGTADSVNAQLKDAVARYYNPPEGIEPEEPSTLPFVAITETKNNPSQPDRGAVERIQQSSGGGGGGGGGNLFGGGSRFAKLEDRVEKFEELIGELNEDVCIEDRRNAMLLLLDYLDGEHSIAVVKDHLLGKDKKPKK